jgi:hypothetical protein
MSQSVIDPMTCATPVPSVSDMQSVECADRRRIATDLRRTAGYIVADRKGRFVGKVECPMYGTSPELPDALAVKAGLLSRHRFMVPADVIGEIDGTSGVIGLRIDRESIRSFL